MVDYVATNRYVPNIIYICYVCCILYFLYFATNALYIYKDQKYYYNKVQETVIN